MLDGLMAILCLVLYLGTVIAAVRSLRREGDLSEREQLWGTVLICGVPIIGVLLWVVVSPTRAWRIFTRHSDRLER